MQPTQLKKAISHLSRYDYAMSRIIKKFGKCNLQAHRNYFKALLQAIVGQQLSIKSAAAINGRLFERFKNQPTPELISAVKEEELKKIGLSNAKIKYVKDLSTKIINKEISMKNFYKKSDEDIIAELTKVKGIGIWTSHMFLIFTLGRLNVLPYGDLGIQKAIMLNYNLRKLPDEQKVISIAKKNNWAPYNSVAAWYLWKTLDFE